MNTKQHRFNPKNILRFSGIALAIIMALSATAILGDLYLHDHPYDWPGDSFQVYIPSQPIGTVKATDLRYTVYPMYTRSSIRYYLPPQAITFDMTIGYGFGVGIDEENNQPAPTTNMTTPKGLAYELKDSYVGGPPEVNMVRGNTYISIVFPSNKFTQTQISNFIDSFEPAQSTVFTVTYDTFDGQGG